MIASTPISTAVTPAALSGKRLTVILLVVLLSTGGLFYWVTTAYSSYNAARRQTDRDWRALASQLEVRYEALDPLVVAEVDAKSMDPQQAAAWRAYRGMFTGTGLTALQTVAALDVEKQISALPAELRSHVVVNDALLDAVAAYQSSATSQRAVGRTMGSRMLKIMLNLPDPLDFDLYTESPFAPRK